MNEIIEIISNPWPWYVSGPLISLVMFLLVWAGGEFGVSSTLSTMCSIGGAGKKIPFFNVDWKKQVWNLVFIIGVVIGGYISATFFKSETPPNISKSTIGDLQLLNIGFSGDLVPVSLFSWEGLKTLQGFIVIVIGGFLVGFGARWAGGCTSGHAISGLSNLQGPSLIAVIGFFIGGLTAVYLLFPLIF